MFRKSYNRAVLRLRVETVTPLLIRAGSAGLDPTMADLACVRTRHARHKTTVYIPGSSFKGVLRSAIEATLRGRTFGQRMGACNPFAKEHHNPERGCGFASKPMQRDSRTIDTAGLYQQHCLACRTFGSTSLKGRVGVRDLFPWAELEGPLSESSAENLLAANDTEVRNNVAIDRIKGSVAVGPFDQELVPAGVSFWGEISFENYQVWQLGLLATALDELNLGFAQLGSSKSRGLGVVRVHVESLVHEQVGNVGGHASGVGRLAPTEELRAYGLDQDPDLPGPEGTVRGLALRFELDEAEATAWLNTGRDALGGL